MTPRSLLAVGAAGAAIAVAAAPALAQTGTLRTSDGSGHAVYKVTERKDPDGGIRKSLSIKACDDRKDGAGIVAGVSGFGDVSARGGVGTCTRVNHFSTKRDFQLQVCKKDASKSGPFVKCRSRSL
jgi:hypothetical protein